MITRNQTKIKYVLTFAALATALVGSVAQATLLVYEPFNYTADVAVDGLSVTGTGLTGTWTSNYSGTDAKIKGGSLTYSTLPVAGNRWGPGGVWLSPWIEATLDPAVMAANLDDGDELWFSFVGGCALSGGTINNRHRLQIGADADNNVAIYENKTADGQGQVRAAITIGGVETVSTGSATFTESTRLFVGRAIFGATDTVEVYLPGPDLALPASPAGTVTGSLDQSTFDMLRSQVTNGNSGVDADEIRIGTTYSDVIGSSVDPTLPEVYAGVNMITWSGQAVQLDPNVVNNDVTPLTYLWTADDPCAVFDPNEFVEAPTVTITKRALILTSLPINNGGFEDPVLGDGGWESNPPAWTDGYYNVAQPGVWVVGDADAGAYNPTAADGYGGLAPEGENVMYATSATGYDRGMSQVLWAKLQANTQYDLSVLVGNPFLFNGSTPTADYRIELLAGGVVLASDTGPSPADDTTWTTAGLTYDSGASPAQLGEALEIRLLAVNLPDPKKEVDFDDVKLTAEGPAPDPYVVALTLAVNNKGSTRPDVEDAMTIDVYDDACEAAISLNAIDPGDFDWNCITDANDLDALATKWLDDYSLTQPVAKP